jgi:hypothetical protein
MYRNFLPARSGSQPSRAMRARNDPPPFLCFDFRPTRLILTRVLRSGSLARAREA